MTSPSIARGIIGQAQPILVGQLALMAYAVVDTVFTGHASAVDLATMGLGLSVYSTVFVGLLGAVNALNPIIAQHYGADRPAAIGAAFVQGLWMALILSAAGCAVLAVPQLWLHRLHAPAEVEPLVTRYLHVLALGLPGSLLFRAIYSLNTAVSRPRVVMALQLVGLALKVFLSYALIYGAFGLPRLGAVGAATASGPHAPPHTTALSAPARHARAAPTTTAATTTSVTAACSRVTLPVSCRLTWARLCTCRPHPEQQREVVP